MRFSLSSTHKQIFGSLKIELWGKKTKQKKTLRR